jgi:hypothetical protein
MASKVMWSEAPKSTTHDLLSLSREELQRAVLPLPGSVVHTSPLEVSTWEERERCGSAEAITA